MKKDGQISDHPLKLHCFLIIIERKITKRKDENLTQLTMPEVFYMATKGGGEFLGKVGSFFFTF